MVRRAKKTTKKKPVKQRVAAKKKTAAKMSERKKAAANNQKAQWVAYKELQMQVDKAWHRLKANVKKKASPSVLIQDKNELLLLLGECNYMARECMRLSGRKRR